MVYDPLLRKDSFADKPWYAEFSIFHAIGVCLVSDNDVLEIREALARFLFSTTTRSDVEPGKTYILGNGEININEMGKYIHNLRNDNSQSQ